MSPLAIRRGRVAKHEAFAADFVRRVLAEDMGSGGDVTSNATNSLKTITMWSCWTDDTAQWHNIMLVTQRSNIGGS